MTHFWWHSDTFLALFGDIDIVGGIATHFWHCVGDIDIVGGIATHFWHCVGGMGHIFGGIATHFWHFLVILTLLVV